MIVQPTQLAALNWAAAAAGTVSGPWKVGAVVSGRVLEQMLGTRLILQINGLTVMADSPSFGQVPRQFQAKVVSGGAQPVLELLSQPAKDLPAAAALRERLPQQGSLQPLLADLHALARMPGARALPEPVRVALARLEASIADRHDVLDPDVLRDTVRRSGMQLEHTLMQHARAPARLPTASIDYDIKAALQRLAEALQPLPQSRVAPFAAGTVAAEAPPPLLQLPLQPQARVPAPLAPDALALAGGMLKHVQTAMSRIEIMQLEAHPSASPQAWMIEVPIRDDDGFDVLQLRFEQEAGDAQAPEAPRWTLGFTIEPSGLGAIHGQIRLRGTQVSVDLWAERDAAVEAMEEQTSVLSQLLEASGLELVQLRVRHGTPLRHTGHGHSLLEASA